MPAKRGVLEFGLWVLRVTGRNPLDYNGYGCYCGLGGRGRPVDATDRYVREYQPIKAETQSQNTTMTMTIGTIRYTLQ